MEIPWSSNPKYNVVEVIWKRRPQHYLAQLRETVEDSTRIVIQERLDNRIIKQAGIPATKVQKKLDHAGFHQDGEWYVTTDGKISPSRHAFR